MDFKSLKSKLPSFSRGGSRESRSPLNEEVRVGFSGPPTPNPGVNAPHQDLALLVTGFVGDAQAAGETVSQLLDKPFDATVKIAGPHRLVGGFLNSVSGFARDRVGKITGT